MSFRRSAAVMLTALAIASAVPALASGSPPTSAIGALTNELEDDEDDFDWGMLGLLGLAGLLGLRRRGEHEQQNSVKRDR